MITNYIYLFSIHSNVSCVLYELSGVSASANEMWGLIWTAVVSELWKHKNNVGELSMI